MWDFIKRWILQDKTAQGRFEAARMVKQYGWHMAWQAYAENATGDEFDEAFRLRLKELAPPDALDVPAIMAEIAKQIEPEGNEDANSSKEKTAGGNQGAGR